MSTTRPICSIIVFVGLLAISNFSAVLAYSWDDGKGWSGLIDCDWSNPGNWSPPGVPGPDDIVFIEPKLPGPCITSDAVCLRLIIMHWSWTGAPNIDVTVISGNFNCGDGIYLCAGDVFDSSTNGSAGLNVFGGTVTTPIPEANGLVIGGGSTTYGDNYGRVNIYGGLVSVPKIAIYYGDVNLYGGTLECTTDPNFILRQDRPENRINVNGGTLKLKGNHAAELSDYIKNARIVCIRGGTLGAPVYNGTWTTLTGTNNFNVAWEPSPDMNATNVHYKHSDGNSITLSWQKGDLAKQHDVYFGTSFVDVNSATIVSAEYKGSRYDANGDPLNWTIADFNFKLNTKYYWRIDETNDSNVLAQGLVWKFTTHDGKAYNPRPINGATALSEPLQLSWTAGDWAASHQVYVGTDFATVLGDINTTAKVYRGTQTGTSYSLADLATNWYGPLVPGTTYYWKITEVNGTTKWGGGLTQSVVWTFTPAAYVNIDDFEDYNTTDELQANWETGYEIAVGGGGITGEAGLKFVRDADGKHMQYTYRNGGSGIMLFSETRRSYNPGTTFTGGGVISPAPKALRIDYRGVATNSVDPVYDRMYVVLEDTAGNVSVYDNPDGNAAQVGDWTSWYSILTDINAAGNTNLNAISGFAIGFGVRGNNYLPGGGDGNVMFDNIRLEPQTCEWPGVFQADFDGDCYVDLYDLALMAQFWLMDCPPSNPCIGIRAPFCPPPNQCTELIEYYPIVDLNGDDIMDFKDFSILGREWKVILLGP
jgi:hypothetical protein